MPEPKYLGGRNRRMKLHHNITQCADFNRGARRNDNSRVLEWYRNGIFFCVDMLSTVRPLNCGPRVGLIVFFRLRRPQRDPTGNIPRSP